MEEHKEAPDFDGIVERVVSDLNDDPSKGEWENGKPDFNQIADSVKYELAEFSDVEIIKFVLESKPEILSECPDNWWELVLESEWPKPGEMIRLNCIDWIATYIRAQFW